jgi:hypothetical protein
MLNPFESSSKDADSWIGSLGEPTGKMPKRGKVTTGS